MLLIRFFNTLLQTATISVLMEKLGRRGTGINTILSKSLLMKKNRNFDHIVNTTKQ